MESSQRVKSNRDLTLSGSGIPHSGVGGDGQSGSFAFEHGIEPSNNVDALTGIFGQPLSVHVRER